MNLVGLISNNKHRKLFYQIALCIVVISFLVFLASNAASSMAKQGIASGFDFLSLETGFDIASSLIPYDSTSSYARLFVAALLNTILISVISIVFATVIGFFVGIIRLSQHPIASKLAAIYVEVMRNIPLLLQVFIWYFAVLQPLPSPRESINILNAFFINNRGVYLPSPEMSGEYIGFFIVLIICFTYVIYCKRKAHQFRVNTGSDKPKVWWFANTCVPLLVVVGAIFLFNIDLSWVLPSLQGFNFAGGINFSPEFIALFLALSTYTGAYIAENVRSGIQSVKKGQIEAGLSLGLTQWQIMRLIVIPNAMRVIIPPLTNQYLNLTKNSSLAAAIAYPDLVLVFAGTALNQTGQAVEILFIVMLTYLFLCLVISIVMNWFNKRNKIVER